MSDVTQSDICLISSHTLRAVARSFFDDINLSARQQTWVDRDSFDAGVVAAARFLLAKADVLEAAAHGEKP